MVMPKEKGPVSSLKEKDFWLIAGIYKRVLREPI